MPYELHIDRRHVATFATSDEALEHARAALKERPGCEPEILDSETKRAFEPAASRRWRDELANKIGY
jgi:hypothetical protein